MKSISAAFISEMDRVAMVLQLMSQNPPFKTTGGETTAIFFTFLNPNKCYLM